MPTSRINVKRAILIVDDDESLCQSVSDYLTNDMLEVLTVHTGTDAIDLCSRKKVDVVLLDQKLPDTSGDKLCAPILSRNEHAKIIFITAYPTLDNALTAIKAGAYDYLSKPFELEELRLIIERSIRTLDLERLELVQVYKESKESERTVLIGNSDAFIEISRMVRLSASSDAPVLITGETGTGKNIISKAIHYSSAPHRKSFISLNCAAIPENLIEAELFGYEKGAFTGASASKKGVFEMAEEGTIFLDEIGEMPIHLQSKLLSVLDDKIIKRLGGESARSVNVRIIAATNIDLSKAIADKRFREDLYYRLSVIRIHIPPLRERKQDIPELCEFLIKNLCNCNEITIPDSELTRLMEYDWPGNVRELKNVIERAIILRKGNLIRPSELIGDPSTIQAAALPHRPAADSNIASLQEVEKTHIKYVLAAFSNNYSRTARTLGISLSTLKRKIREYGII